MESGDHVAPPPEAAVAAAAPSGDGVDSEARENGGVKPTHGRTMKEQKAWFLQRAKAHVSQSASVVAAEQKRTAPKEDHYPFDRPPPPSDSADTSSTPSGAPPAPPPAAIDVTDGSAPAAAADGLADKLRELEIAGGDLPALSQLANSGNRTDLTTALKALGFKGLRTRQELEGALKAWSPQ
jgi:hypothetical protein